MHHPDLCGVRMNRKWGKVDEKDSWMMSKEGSIRKCE